MATARWFFEPEPNSKFVIQEHLRQDYWRAGPAQLWVDAVQTTPPYKAVGYWHEVTFELEWIPREYVELRSSRKEPELIRATTLQLGFRPAHEAEEGGKHVVRWHLRPATGAEADMSSRIGATPVISVGAGE